MVTLDRLVNVLAGYGVRLHGRPVPRSTELRRVVVYDPMAERTITGEVLLAVGTRSIAEALSWATITGAEVVVVQGRADLVREAAALGDRAEAAVMVVDPGVSWSELAGVVYGLVLEGRETDSGRGPTDLFALADSLATTVGGAVTIEDRSARLLAYSTSLRHDADPARVATILGREAPADVRELLRERGVPAHLTTSDEPLFVAADQERGLTGRMVVAVRAGRELLGSVWVSCREPLTGSARAALADGARTVALHLLRSRASADLERQVESELVIRLLEGAAGDVAALDRLGLPSRPMRVIAVRPRAGTEPHAALLLAFERATTGFGWSRPGRSAVLGSTLYTVLPGEDAAVARQWVATLRATLPGHTVVRAGIGAAATIDELPAGRQEADECLALHETRGPDVPPPAYDESWDDILLQRLRTAARAGRVPARGPVAELRRHDRQHGTHYVATLRSWLAAQGDLAAAGEQLDVHQNTVRNRLRRMAEITALRLDDPTKRLAMSIDLAATDELGES